MNACLATIKGRVTLIPVYDRKCTIKSAGFQRGKQRKTKDNRKRKGIYDLHELSGARGKHY